MVTLRLSLRMRKTTTLLGRYTLTSDPLTPVGACTRGDNRALVLAAARHRVVGGALHEDGRPHPRLVLLDGDLDLRDSSEHDLDCNGDGWMGTVPLMHARVLRLCVLCIRKVTTSESRGSC